MDLLAEKMMKLFGCGMGCVVFLEKAEIGNYFSWGRMDFLPVLSRVRIALLFGVCPEGL